MKKPIPKTQNQKKALPETAELFFGPNICKFAR